MDEKPKNKPREGRAGGSPNMGAYILIGIGVFLLLANLGIIAGLFRLWPLILIAIGAYLLIGRNATPSEMHHEHFSAPRDAAESARVSLNLSVGEATVAPVTDPALLIDAEVNYLGEVQFVATGDSEKFVSLGPTSSYSTEWLNPANWFGHGQYRDLRWNVGLNPDVATNLDIHGGLGKSRLDLGRFRLTGLEITSGVGEMDITLPAQAIPQDTLIRVGVGKLNVIIPSGANLEATIKGGIGETNVSLPLDVPARVEASSGVGELSVSSRLQKISGNEGGIGPRGVWQTADFKDGEPAIVIHYEGGIGALKVR